MSLVDVKVELGFNFAGSSAGVFYLDSDTFGVLGTSRLGDLVFFDVSQYVKSCSSNRGRSRQLDYYNAGTATVVFDNRDREFDPLNQSSTYYGGIEPRGLVRITAGGNPVFYGYINDWNLSYDLAGNDVATVYCSDAFSILANQVLTAFTPSAELSGARVNTVLSRSEVDFVGGRNVDAGTLTLGAYAVAQDTNVLNYLRQVERSENGALFVDAAGDITFLGRTTPPTTSVITFSDDGSGVPYQSLTNQFGDELLYNYVRLTSPAGAEQIASDAASILLYQTSQLSYDDLLNNSTGVVNFLAVSYLNKFSTPRLRLTGFGCQLVGLDLSDVNSVLSLDLADYVYIKKSFEVGTPSSYTQFSRISGISHNVTPGSHTVTFSIENAEGGLYLVLGDVLAGQLDYNLLDF